MSIENQASQIKLLICDVDGVLTNGKVILGNDQQEFKHFNIKDGLGIRLLQKAGVETAIITAKLSEAVKNRAAQLGIEHVFQGVSDKKTQYETLKTALNLNDQDIAYIGDDWIDLPVMTRVGLSCAVADAHPEVCNRAHVTTQAKGGEGAVRELADIILKAQGKYDALLEGYLN